MCLDSSNPSLSISKIKDACLSSGTHKKKCIPNDQFPVENHDVNYVENCVDDISAAIPSLDLNREDDPYEEANSNPSHPVCHYNLRSLDKKPETLETVGGIGLTPPPSLKRKIRGRKSNLSKAQVKAKFDVADGKQMSITGALRAAITPDLVVK